MVTDCSVRVRNAGSASIRIFNWVEGKQDQPFIFFIWKALIFLVFSLFSAKICQEENAKEKQNILRKLLSIISFLENKTEYFNYNKL